MSCSVGAEHKHSRRTHRHPLTYYIFGITTSAFRGLWGRQSLPYGPFHSWPPVPNTSSVASQQAFFNQLTFISLPCSSMSLYGPFSSHKPLLCPPQPLSGRVNPHLFLAKKFFDVDVSTGIEGNQTTRHASQVTVPLLFSILCNSACQLRKIDVSKSFKCNKSSKRKITCV